MKYNNHDKIRDFIIIEAYMFRFKKKVKPEVDMTIKEFILLNKRIYITDLFISSARKHTSI